MLLTPSECLKRYMSFDNMNNGKSSLTESASIDRKRGDLAEDLDGEAIPGDRRGEAISLSDPDNMSSGSAGMVSLLFIA